MTRLDTDPMTPGQRTGRAPSHGMPMLIQVPRVDEPHERVRPWRPRSAGRGLPSGGHPSLTGAAGYARAGVRPRRRLRRGVRRAGWSLLVVAAMAGTFTMGWTSRGGGLPLSPLLGTTALARAGGQPALAPEEGARPSEAAPSIADAEPFAVMPALGAPVADAEVPVVFPGYLLPDNNREEPAHEGS